MVTSRKPASGSISVFRSYHFRFVVLIIVLISLLPTVSFGRANAAAPVPELLLAEGSEADFIIGPQLATSSGWFDDTEIAKARAHGEAFPATPPTTELEIDNYILTHYYDLGLTEYVAYRRTGDPIFLSYARKVSDSWWLGPYIQGGTIRQFDSGGPAPRHAGIGGLALRALDGRPELWDWLNAYTRYHFNVWLKMRINNP
jgi:hypothetical protein